MPFYKVNIDDAYLFVTSESFFSLIAISQLLQESREAGHLLAIWTKIESYIWHYGTDSIEYLLLSGEVFIFMFESHRTKV